MVKSSEVGGRCGSGIFRLIPRIPDQRFGGNDSSPDVSRRWTASRWPPCHLISKRKECFPIFWGYFCNIVPTKNKVYHPVNLDIGVNPRVIAFDSAREFSPCSELR